VKRYTYNEYENIVDSDVTYTKLNTYFDLNNYLNYTSEKATCMDFCLDIMEKESVSIEIINSAYDEYIEVKKEIKKT
jgi:predicted RNA-binding protein associated with RNAse of E/G family